MVERTTEARAAAKARALMSPDYDPDRLLDYVRGFLLLKNDAALSRHLGLTPPQISRVRHRAEVLTPVVMLAILDAVPGMTAHELRARAGLPAWRGR
jgi:hypothetical protein